MKLKIPVFLSLLIISSVLVKAGDKVKLSFSHERGFYTDPFTLTITADTTAAIIKYTLDGTNPLTSTSAVTKTSTAEISVSPLITTGRDKSPGFIITACAILNDTLASKIVTHTYMFLNRITELSVNNARPGSGWMTSGVNGQQINYGLDPNVYNNSLYKPEINAAFTAIPTLSLVTDLKNLFNADSGIYVNAQLHGDEWERTASLELLNPDSSEGFNINCGIRIRGGYSRIDENPKHAFRVFFREEYGKSKLEYPLFGDEGTDEFDKIDIQTAQNYSWSFYGNSQNTFLREIFSRDVQRDMEQPYTRGKFCHLYINGTYWGLFQMQERSEASFAASYMGGEKEDYDVIKVNVGENFEVYNVEATDGTIDKWRELWNAGQTGFVSDELYYKVQGLNLDGTINSGYEKLLDVDNLIDYMLCTFFVGDYDGPVSAFLGNEKPNNFYAIYNRVIPDGFKFFRHDAEHSLGAGDMDGTDRTGPFNAGSQFVYSNPQWIHQKLMDNPHYKLRFADRFYKHFYNDGALTKENNITRINKRKSQIETAIIAESARWGDSQITPARTKADWTSAVNYITQTYLPARNNVVLNQLINKGLFLRNFPPQFSPHGGIVVKGSEFTLTSSDTGDIYYTTNGTDPYLPYSGGDDLFTKEVIAASANKRVLVPTALVDGAWKSSATFDDAAWLLCSGAPGGIGYDYQSTDYDQYIKLDVESKMHTGNSNINNSCFIRVPFQVTADEQADINYMKLNIKYDDGFVAYINGVEVARANFEGTPVWNSQALTTSAEPVENTSIDISAYVNALKSGTNILAVQGLNYNIESSDFLILPTLTVGKTSGGGSVSPDAIKYTGAVTIDRTTTIKTRAVSGTAWTALNEAEFKIREDLSNLRITELHYHPLDVDTTNDGEYEFIELKNVGDTELSLIGAGFINGIEYTFGEATVAPNSFVVLASNAVKFNELYGFAPFGEFEGQLDNGGERVTFINSVGDTVINFKYSDDAPWPAEADGLGYSLVSKSISGQGNPDTSIYWAVSGVINGSPGADDAVSGVEDIVDFIPSEYRLLQNYPNPFNPVTNIVFSMPVSGQAELKIFDILGREVTTLVNEVISAGEHSIQFNAASLASGVYYYRLKVNDFTCTNKMVLLR
jgi:hypothetical protein